MGLFIYTFSDITSCGSYSCFNKFIEYFKVPLGVSALCFPLVALVISSHRSKQTAEQIKSSDSQNFFSNFYKHQEEFIKCVKTLEERHNLKCENYLELYSDLFPNNSPKKLAFTLNDDNDIGAPLRIAKEKLEALLMILNDDNISLELTQKFFIDLSNIGPILYIKSNDHIKIDWPETGYPPDSKLYISFNKERPLEHFYQIQFVIRHLMAFCGIDDIVRSPLRNNNTFKKNATSLLSPKPKRRAAQKHWSPYSN